MSRRQVEQFAKNHWTRADEESLRALQEKKARIQEERLAKIRDVLIDCESTSMAAVEQLAGELVREGRADRLALALSPFLEQYELHKSRRKP